MSSFNCRGVKKSWCCTIIGLAVLGILGCGSQPMSNQSALNPGNGQSPTMNGTPGPTPSAKVDAAHSIDLGSRIDSAQPTAPTSDAGSAHEPAKGVANSPEA